MVDAPEKIWAVFGNHGLLAFRDDRPHSVEYTRSDLVAELEAENARLMEDGTRWSMEASRYAKALDKAREREAEALSRTGAVKVKALLLDFEDFINQPPQYEDQRMVRDYRHELYRKWGPLCMAVLSALESAAPEHPANLADDDVDAAYQAALDNLPAEFRGEVGRGELDLMVRAIVKAHDSKWERRARAMAHHHHSALQASIDTSKPAAPEGQQPVAGAAAPSGCGFDNDHLAWACERWQREVANRPLRNVHRRTLDDTWRQIIRRLGGDPAILLPMAAHDTLAAENPDAAIRSRPAEQAVTEAMVEAAIAAMFHGHGWFPPPYAMRAALKAAMEAGRHD